MSRGSSRADHAAPSAPVVSHQNLVQRSDSADHRAERSVPPIVHEVLREPGDPLDDATRAPSSSRGSTTTSVACACTPARERSNRPMS